MTCLIIRERIMKFNTSLRQATEIGVSICAIALLFLAGCGGGFVSSSSGGVTSATVVPFKGKFLKGYVVIKDANGNVVPLVLGGTINASGVAEVAFDSNVAYPLIVEVSGDYYNEITGGIETGTVPLRGIIATASEMSASSAIPVTIITETAVADLQNRLGAFNPNNPIETASAVAALQMAGFALGIPATTVPSFDPVTNRTGDPDTLRLAALAVVAGNQLIGTTLIEKIKLLAHRMATINPASAPTDVITQADFDSALSAITTGPNGMMVVGATPPAPSNIGTLSQVSITSLCNPVISGGLVGGESSVGQVYLSNPGGILTSSASSVGGIVVSGTAANYGFAGSITNTGQLTVGPDTVGVLVNSGGTLTQSNGITLAMAVAPSANTQAPAENISWAAYPISSVIATSWVDLRASSGAIAISGVIAPLKVLPTSQLRELLGKYHPTLSMSISTH